MFRRIVGSTPRSRDSQPWALNPTRKAWRCRGRATQCSALVDEATDLASRHAVKQEAPAMLNQALQLIVALRKEFPAEHAQRSVAVDSIYTRYLENTGKPLTDSYHFGQTLINDFGRPYEGASSSIAGFSAYAVVRKIFRLCPR